MDPDAAGARVAPSILHSGRHSSGSQAAPLDCVTTPDEPAVAQGGQEGGASQASRPLIICWAETSISLRTISAASSASREMPAWAKCDSSANRRSESSMRTHSRAPIRAISSPEAPESSSAYLNWNRRSSR